jgi:hypothetical protein
MSLWSDLYAGDARQIADAFKEGRAFEGKQFVSAHVNLPGIVPDMSGELPNTPDLLTELACSTVGIERFTFAESIAEQLSGDPDPMVANDGAYLMTPRWTELFARITESQTQELAVRWLKELDPGAAELPARVSEMNALLRSLTNTCRVAQERRVSLVYAWTL